MSWRIRGEFRMLDEQWLVRPRTAAVCKIVGSTLRDHWPQGTSQILPNWDGFAPERLIWAPRMTVVFLRTPSTESALYG